MKRTSRFFVLTLVFLSILPLSFISASCSEGQIDINTASLEELDKIIEVGNATAIKIVNARPFNSVDDLVKVSGIKEAKLAAIKSQNLACVEDENSEDNKESEEAVEVNTTLEGKINNSPLQINTTLQPINLGPKAIKSAENSEISDKSDFAIYALVIFAILLGLLFLIKNLVAKKKQKNEFT